jgi:hypothetical protein
MRMIGFDFFNNAEPPASEDLAKAWKPYIETCIAAFGPQRSMFESNFPVDKGTCSYPVLWNAFKRLAASVYTLRQITERILLLSTTHFSSPSAVNRGEGHIKSLRSTPCTAD